MVLFSRPWRIGLVFALAIATGMLSATAPAQPRPQFNERTIEPELNPNDKEGVWTLHFKFKDPRVIPIDVPGRGRKIVWYMWYQVYNMTGEPRPLVPEFELVTLDRNTVHTDEILPTVQTAIAKREDDTGRLDIKNSITIQKDLIPVTKKESFPRAVTGLAIWSDIYDRAPDTNHFYIFVSGLSNGMTDEDDRGVRRRKTLQLEFKRLGNAQAEGGPIKWTERAEWVYRATASSGKTTPKKNEAPAEGVEPKERKPDAPKKEEKE
jgi:hypothetical protein